MFKITDETFSKWLEYKSGKAGYDIQYQIVWVNKSGTGTGHSLIEGLMLKERGSLVTDTKGFKGHQVSFYIDTDFVKESEGGKGNFYIGCNLYDANNKSYRLRNTSWFTVTSIKRVPEKVGKFYVNAESRALVSDVKMYIGKTFLPEDGSEDYPVILDYRRIHTYWLQCVPEVKIYDYFGSVGRENQLDDGDQAFPLMFGSVIGPGNARQHRPPVSAKIDTYDKTLNILAQGLRDIYGKYLFLPGIPQGATAQDIVQRYNVDMLLSERLCPDFGGQYSDRILPYYMIEDAIMRDFSEWDRLLCHSWVWIGTDEWTYGSSKDTRQYSTSWYYRMRDRNTTGGELNEVDTSTTKWDSVRERWTDELSFTFSDYLQYPDVSDNPFYYNLTRIDYARLIDSDGSFVTAGDSLSYFNPPYEAPSTEGKSIYRLKELNFPTGLPAYYDGDQKLCWSIQKTLRSEDATADSGTFLPWVYPSVNQESLIFDVNRYANSSETIRGIKVDALPVLEIEKQEVVGSTGKKVSLDAIGEPDILFTDDHKNPWEIKLARRYRTVLKLALVPFIEIYDIIRCQTMDDYGDIYYVYCQVIEKQESDADSTMTLTVESAEEIRIPIYE